MDSSTETFQTSPPHLIASIIAGFNTVANNAYLIFFPIVLDLLIWFGPHFRVKTLLQPLVNLAYTELSKSMDAQTLAQAIPDPKTTLDSINLLGSLRSWPVGIPSLFSFSDVMQTPFGKPTMIEIPTLVSAFAFLVLAILVGIYLGSVYFNFISNASLGLKKPFSFSLSLWQFRQSLTLSILLLFLLLLIALPVGFVLALFLLFQLAFFGGIVVAFLLVWIMLPLVFSAHGIFMFKLSVIPSIATSVRLVRSFLPGTGVFLLVAYILNTLMNFLWRTTPADSWLTLIGVAGHAFIASALLAASFVYYGSGMRWMQENLQHMAARQSQG